MMRPAVFGTFCSNSIALCPNQAVRLTPPPQRKPIRCTTARAAKDQAESSDQGSQAWQSAGEGQYEPGPLGQGYQRGPEQGYPNQYYQQQQPYPNYAPPRSSGGGVPWGWMLFGAAAALIISKVVEFFSPAGGGPQARMMSMMMSQAMKGSGGAGGSPFGGATPGGFPDFSKMAQGGFPGAPTPPPSKSSQSSFVDAQARSVDRTAGAQATSPTATASSATTAEAEAPSSNEKGAKFEEMRGRRRRRGNSSAASFTDVDKEETATSGGAGAGASTEAPPSDEENLQMLDTMMQDPNIQEMLYQHLPEPMRNKETFDWMLSNPEYRKQLAQTLKAQGANLDPNMYEQLKGVNAADVTDQLAKFGMTPTDVMQKIMGDPELAEAFQKPHVQKAIMESQSNPEKMNDYWDDPDVMLVFRKMNEMFPQATGM